MTAPAMAMHRGFEAEVGLPGTELWHEIQADEERLWPAEYGLSSAEYNSIYSPYDERSVLMRMRNDGSTFGVARDILPKPHASSFASNQVGLLTIHAALAEDDAHGTPVFGKLTFWEPEGWQTINAFDARTCTDSVTHIVPPSQRGGLAVLGLQSLEFGLSQALFDYRTHDESVDINHKGPAVVTCLVRTYRDRLEPRYAATTASGETVQGFHRLGPESVYGGRSEDEWVTPVVVSVRDIVKADQLRRPNKPFVSLNLFKIACPEFNNYLQDYLRGEAA
jgi:hypothetical protein